MVTVFRVSSKPMAAAEVATLLRNPPEEVVSNLPPVRPKGGEMYIYRPNREEEKGK